jgi:hypothetical protein
MPHGYRYLWNARLVWLHIVSDVRIGRREMVKQKAKLDDLVREAVAELPDEPDTRKIEYRIEPLPEQDCDPGLLKLDFLNLLSNAVKFTRGCQAAVIEAGTRKIDRATECFVRDNGVGFDPEYADKLFGVFQRLHRQEDFERTGIKSATVQGIIHRHGRTIWAEYWDAVPRLSSPWAACRKRLRWVPRGRRSVAESDVIEILLVEDNASDAESTLHALLKSRPANFAEFQNVVEQLGLYRLPVNSKPPAAAFRMT